MAVAAADITALYTEALSMYDRIKLDVTQGAPAYYGAWATTNMIWGILKARVSLIAQSIFTDVKALKAHAADLCALILDETCVYHEAHAWMLQQAIDAWDTIYPGCVYPDTVSP